MNAQACDADSLLDDKELPVTVYDESAGFCEVRRDELGLVPWRKRRGGITRLQRGDTGA